MTGSLARRCGAELVGTALLIIFGPGSVVAALSLGHGGDLDYAGLGTIGLSFGLVVALVIYAFGTTSGAHINPAVTVALAATSRFPWRDVGAYVVAQLVGALAGGLLVVGAFGPPRSTWGASAGSRSATAWATPGPSSSRRWGPSC